MSVYSKIFLTFKKPFWGDLEYFYIMSAVKGRYALWKPMSSISKNVIFCVINGDEAKRVEGLSEQALKDEIEDHLKKAY